MLGALSSWPRMSGGGLLPCFGRHSLRPENSAESPRQVQSRHDLVCDQRLSAARPEFQGPVFDEIWGTHQSGLGTEGVRLLWSLHHHFGVCITTLESASPLLSSRGSSWVTGKLTKPALNPEKPTPVVACPWVGRWREGQSTRMSVSFVPVSPHL